MTFIVANNIIASWPLEHQPTGTPHDRAKITQEEPHFGVTLEGEAFCGFSVNEKSQYIRWPVGHQSEAPLLLLSMTSSHAQDTLICGTDNVMARAVGVPVGRRLGGWLATMLVATINLIIFFFFHLFFTVSTFS